MLFFIYLFIYLNILIRSMLYKLGIRINQRRSYPLILH